MKYEIGRAKLPYVGATVYSDVLGETFLLFSNLNQIMSGVAVTINSGKDFIIACHDTLIVQLFNYDLTDVVTNYIDCQ